MIDHYRILGLARSANRSAIRAAYLSAMRRFHPDQNPSPEAAERAKLISVAYATLSDPQRRAAFDRQLVANRAARHPMPVFTSPARGRNAAVVMSALAAVLIAFAATRPSMAPTTPAEADRPVQLAKRPTAESASGGCPASIGHDEARGALFRAAAWTTPGDLGAFAVAAAHSTVRATAVSSTGSEMLGNRRCEAVLLVELPPDLVTQHGARSLVTEVAFLPADKPGAFDFEVDELVGSTLRSVTSAHAAIAPPPADGPPLPLTDAVAPSPAPAIVPVRAQPAKKPEPTVAAALPARRPERPSRAASPAASSGIDLAALEQHQSLLYRQSYLQADGRKRALLLNNRASFLRRLGDCTSDRCRRDAYLSRNQQIVTIMSN
jgi:hypothetical protein